MNRLNSCLSVLFLCYAAMPLFASQPTISQGLFATAQSEIPNYKSKYDLEKHNFEDVRKARDLADYQLTCQNQKLAHILAFSDMQKKSLEERNAQLAQKSYGQDKVLEEKNEQISHLFKEINTVRKMLHESLNTRNNLERAYINLDQKLQATLQNFQAQTKHSNHKLIAVESARKSSIMSESKALQHVSLLEQALRDNERFYTQDMYKVFNNLAVELEETRKQLAIATDACLETEQELDVVKKQLETTQQLLGKQGASAKTEKDIKAIQASIAKVGKTALEGKETQHHQLTQALDHIKQLDQKLIKAQSELDKNDRDIQQRTAREAKHIQDFKLINSELNKFKREYRSNLAQNTLQLSRTIRALELELQTAKLQATRTQRTIEAKDQAFETLEKHSKTLQAQVASEEAAQKSLISQLRTKESEAKSAQAKLARVEQTEQALRSITAKTQKELAAEAAQKKTLALQLRNVSKKLADAELTKEQALYTAKNLTRTNEDLVVKLGESEKRAFSLEEERNMYMFERHAFARTAERIASERNLFAERLNSIIQTVSRVQENSKLGINHAHPSGTAII